VRLFHFRPLSLSRARVLSFFPSCSRSLARSLALFLSRLFARSVAFSLSGVGGGTNGRRRRQTAVGTRRHRSDPFLFPSFSGYIPFRTLSKVVCDQFVVSCWAGETSLILIQYVAASDTSTHTRPVCRSLTHTHVHARTHARTHTHAHTLSLTLSHKPLQARQADRRNVNRYRLLAMHACIHARTHMPTHTRSREHTHTRTTHHRHTSVVYSRARAHTGAANTSAGVSPQFGSAAESNIDFRIRICSVYLPPSPPRRRKGARA